MPSEDFLYSDKDHERVPNLFKVQIFFMACMGQTPSILDEYFPAMFRTIGRFLMRLYSVSVVLSTLHTAILFVITTFDVLQYGKLDEITDAMTQAFIFNFSCFSSCYWLWHCKTLSEFIDHVNGQYWQHSIAGATYVNSYGAYAKARRIAIIWLGLAIVGVSSYGFTPLLQGVRTLPLRCWYPFDPLQSWVYPIIYWIQMFSQFNVGITFASSSANYESFVILMLGQFDVLFCSVKNLQYHAMLTAGEDLRKLRKIQAGLPKPTDAEVNQYLLVKEEKTNLARFENMYEKRPFTLALRESVIKCVQLHRFILNSCTVLEHLFHPFCLIKSLQVTIQLCLLVFVGVAGEKTPMRLLNLLQYLILTLIELFLFCYLGELLKQHSTRLGEALFRSEWHTYAPSARKELLILLSNSKRAVKLTAGKFFVMDLERLRSVVAQAFSFVTLLQKIEAKGEK